MTDRATPNLVAAAPVVPPREWFSRPDFDGPQRITVDGDRVYGYLATWGTCHLGFGADRCVQPPPSHHDYAYFHTGVIDTTDGPVEVGTLTMDTGHADKRMKARPAAAHYDNTGVAFADVTMGEDEIGIWFSGALRPGVTDEQKRIINASGVSGDWRKIGGGLELVAALAVNNPGFPVIESHLAASGCPESLIASGVILGEQKAPANAPHPSRGLLAGAEAIAARIGRDKRSRKLALVQRVHGEDD